MSTRIHDFEIIRTLGTGAFGTVVEATDPANDGRRVAIKVLHQNLIEDPLVVQRFFQEALILAKFKHAAIPTVHSFGPWEGTYYLVQEFIEGPNMFQVLQEGAMPVEKSIDLTRKLLDALAYAHEEEVIHRDLKPDNLVIQADGSLKILDFGIAKILGGVQLTKPGKINVTLPYAAPEQLVGQAMDRRTDLYAAGILLHEMLVGSVPFKSEIKEPFGALQEQVKWARGERPSLREKCPEAPEWLDEFYLKLTSASMNDRFEDAGQARDALDVAREGAEGKGPKASDAPKSDKPRIRADAKQSSASQSSGEPAVLAPDAPTMALDDANEGNGKKGETVLEKRSTMFAVSVAVGLVAIAVIVVVAYLATR